jgi:hypothetical protein
VTYGRKKFYYIGPRTRYKVNNKVLKIKSAELEDTGVFNCKGVNGFGSDSVRLELIVVGKETFTLATIRVRLRFEKRMKIFFDLVSQRLLKRVYN